MHSFHHRVFLLAALVVLALLSLSSYAPGVAAVPHCNVKTKSPSPSSSPVSPSSPSSGGDVGYDDDEDVVTTPAPTTKKPKKTKKTKKPKTTTAPVAPLPTNNTPVPAAPPSPSLTPAVVPADASTTAPAVPAAEANATKTTRPSSNNTGGKCVTSDPTGQYISKAHVDWIWEKRMKPHFNFNNFIFDQLMANNGKLQYCIRWDSTNKLPKTTAAKFQAMLQRQYDQWNKWLVGYGCWPFDKIELEMVGVAVRDKALVDWTDDSLGPIYEKVLDADGIPMCPEACYKHRDFQASSDTSACKGKPFDISLWPTLGQGGGAGGDWGQRVDEANMLSSLDSGSSVIVAHEIGHGFGLPDFYEEGDKPAKDMPKLIMEAGASMSVTEGDGWLLRRGWEFVRMRYPSTSG